MAKFHGDRSRDGGGNLAKEKKKHHEHFLSPPVTTYGRPNNVSSAWGLVSGSQKYAKRCADRWTKSSNAKRKAACIQPTSEAPNRFLPLLRSCLQSYLVAKPSDAPRTESRCIFIDTILIILQCRPTNILYYVNIPTGASYGEYIMPLRNMKLKCNLKLIAWHSLA